MLQTFQKQDGFIALISIVIISAILIIMVFSLSTSSFFLRFNVLDNEAKKSSLALANACVHQALLNLATGTATAGPTNVPVGSSSCKICSINPLAQASNPKTILTRAVTADGASNSYSNVTALVNQDAFGNFTVSSWTESPAYGGPSCPVP